ncbi:MAG: hypothetical protein WC966_02030 [Bradymonadales bacterium]|jgi:hypothetical protein
MLKRFQIVFFAIAVALLFSACGPSFSDYMRDARSTQVNSTIIRDPEVIIESRNSAGRSRGKLGMVIEGINVASDVAATAVSMEQQKRLQEILSPDDLVMQIHQALTQQLTRTINIDIVDTTQASDVRINTIVKSYGINASSITSPFYFYVYADVDVIYLPENKRIYRRPVVLQRSLSDLDMYGSIASAAISGAMNLSAFFSLSDPQIVEIFNYLAVELGNTIATYIYNDSLS